MIPTNNAVPMAPATVRKEVNNAVPCAVSCGGIFLFPHVTKGINKQPVAAQRSMFKTTATQIPVCIWMKYIPMLLKTSEPPPKVSTDGCRLCHRFAQPRDLRKPRPVSLAKRLIPRSSLICLKSTARKAASASPNPSRPSKA